MLSVSKGGEKMVFKFGSYKSKLDEVAPNVFTLGDTYPKKFIGLEYNIDEAVLFNCFEYAYKMAEYKKQRENRSGGTIKRNKLEIFWDDFRGKIAECYVKEYYENQGCEVKGIDFAIYDRGQWDKFDLRINGKVVSVKSSKHFSQLLLLETADWKDGKYVGDTTNGKYSVDYFMFVRTLIQVPEGFESGNELNKDVLWDKIKSINIKAEISGVLSHFDFREQVTKYRYIIPKGAWFRINPNTNGTRMDAENYYVKIAELQKADANLFF